LYQNYWNWITTVEIIVGVWVVYFFGDTVYKYTYHLAENRSEMTFFAVKLLI